MKTFTYKDSDIKSINTILKKLQSIQSAFLRTKSDLGTIMPSIYTQSADSYFSVGIDVTIHVKENGTHVDFIKNIRETFMLYSHLTEEENRENWKEIMENLINSLNENYAEV